MNYILYSIGLLIGSFFPDIDQKIKWLRHRSILTHSAIIPIILAISLKGEKELSLISGFCVGMAMHKLFDLFQKWHVICINKTIRQIWNYIIYDVKYGN